jgi:uncharacterized membrane protein
MTFDQVSLVIAAAVEWLHLALEALGAITIGAGTVASLIRGVRNTVAEHRVHFTEMRFELTRYLALALEFQLAADVLETAIAPEWSKIGHLAAIGAIRTALNYFISRELARGRTEVEGTTVER